MPVLPTQEITQRMSITEKAPTAAVWFFLRVRRL